MTNPVIARSEATKQSTIFYDLHIHTALSPCAEDDMTPCNIVQMAALKGLDVIAITDHNETGNARACIDAAAELGLPLIVLPGMELETAEEIHVVCLFADVGAAEAFNKEIQEYTSKIVNKPHIFGNQLYMDKNDNVVNIRQELLLAATSLSIDDAFKKAREYGGVAIPAHIDRDSYSILSIFGVIPEHLNATVLELSKRTTFGRFLAERGGILGDYKLIIGNSDAHNLSDIAEPERILSIIEKSPQGIIAALTPGVTER